MADSTINSLDPTQDKVIDHFTCSLLVQVVKQGLEASTTDQKHEKLAKVAEILEIELQASQLNQTD